MRVELKTSGGIAAFPGLQKPVVLDTAALGHEAAAELVHWVEAARFFELPPTLPSDQRRRDTRQHVLSVSDSGRSHTVTRAEPLTEPGLAELVAFLRGHARRPASG